MKQITLNNGNKIDILGLGTYRLNNQNEVTEAIKTAYDLGIKLLDTAEMYDNELQIGKAIKDLHINRSEMFITSKVWDSSGGYDATMRAFEKSLKRLQTDYLDLYLIHWPASSNFIDTWKALENLYEQGVCKNIGVSNFDERDLQILFNKAKIIPAVNQIEVHIFSQKKKLRNFCKQHNIAIESWAPLMKGAAATNSVLKHIGRKYGKTAIQTAVKWHIDQELIVIPKSAKPQHIKEFANIWDFSLTKQDFDTISD
jgi:diketogulonate reductase-like aldo/keto reductase